jgi:probable phosphoglycerate mutase
MPLSLIVEADGGSRGNPGPAAYGAVVRDAASGSVLAELAEYLGEVSNNVAEYRGALAGLVHARELDPDATVEMRLDSKLIVEQMSGRWQIKHPDMRDLAKQVRAAFPPGQVSYTWVPREENHRADALVNEMIDAALAGQLSPIRRLDGRPSDDEFAEDVVGSIEVENSRALLESVQPPRVMIGWADLGPPTYTVMARHGATALSLEKRFSGLGGIDAPLADLGRAQAQALAGELVARGDIDRIISSPLLRTRQTAEIIARPLGQDVEIVEGFAECAFGEWDGHTFSEVRERWPRELEEWLASTQVAPPGGESFEECQRRVLKAREIVIERYPGERVLVVAHVTPIKVMVAHAVGAPLDSLYRMELPPCSLSSLAWFPDGNASMFSFAEASHLRGISTPHGV